MPVSTESIEAVRARLKSALDSRDHTSVRDIAQDAIDERRNVIEAVMATAQREARDVNAGEMRQARAIQLEVNELQGYVERADAENRSQFDNLRTEFRSAQNASRATADQWSKPNPGGNIRMGRDERTYHEGNAREVSFIRDAWAMRNGDSFAAERIERSQREAALEYRDTTTSTYNGLIPPNYLIEKFAPLARAGRPFADVVPREDLPPEGMSLVVTKTTTGTATAVQTTQNTAATETDMVTTDITIPVVTIQGQQDLSRQSVERGQVSDLVFGDLLLDYHTKLDADWLRGAGTSNASKGIITANTQYQTWTGTTVASFMSKVLGAANDVTTAISLPPTCIVVHPRRWHWLLAQSDSNGRPIVTPFSAAAQNVQGIGGTGYGVAAGELAGLPVVVDANVGTSHGVSTDEDRVIVTRLDRLVGWEGRNSPMVFRFESVAAPQSIRLAVFGYEAFTAERYTTGTSAVVGTGLVAPSF